MEDNWWDIDAEMEREETPHNCSTCYYWTGNPGNMPTDLVCAVNIPNPSNIELEWVDGRKAYALHNCKDYKETK
jgi:hypothetical protein